MTPVRYAFAMLLTCTALLGGCSDSRSPGEARTTAPAPTTGPVPGAPPPSTSPTSNAVLPPPVDAAAGPATSPPLPVPQAARDDVAKKAPEWAESAAAATAPPPAARENTGPSVNPTGK